MNYTRQIGLPSGGLDPDYAGMLVNDSLAPTQWFDLHRRNDHDFRPEKRLIWQCLVDAVQLATFNRSPLSADARNWIRSADTGVFSFEWCCEQLDIVSSAIRLAVLCAKQPVRLQRQPRHTHPQAITHKPGPQERAAHRRETETERVDP